MIEVKLVEEIAIVAQFQRVRVPISSRKISKIGVRRSVRLSISSGSWLATKAKETIRSLSASVVMKATVFIGSMVNHSLTLVEKDTERKISPPSSKTIQESM